jgi:hypothetical protein
MLTHFHSVLWLSDSSYPLLSYVLCLFESTLLAIVFLALFLNVFTKIVRGYGLGVIAVFMLEMLKMFPRATLR